ncbi:MULTISPECIES: P-II family nitrogen regulator [Acetobacterium]|jgi:nitrogen regulatory protein PII|uniref:P-II family nitrogen regulator n=1 Tax=Acetobacterium TaxID=33951 RepID=UPI000DBEC5CE|nr:MULTISPECIES: P-II family nitrogen regulator [unclassified Acetobacterium]AWW27500.1 P-II family nitrogen regulator [Acetobacterium sp. KB-1]MDZ5724017.1 P-II family nitrogen regulator [Acetobacterium sp. K1/6]
MNTLENTLKKSYEMLAVIVNFGVGSKVLHLGKKYGISGGTIFLGKGTQHCLLNDFFDICDERVEVVLMIAQTEKIESAAEAISQKFKFAKANHGIAFTAALNNFLGVRNCFYDKTHEEKGVNKTMYEAIFVIVDRGNAETVVGAAEAAGAKGGTIMNARGSGIHEYSKLFAMDIEPEKEVVMLILETAKTETVVNAIQDATEMSKPGNGIIFTIGVNRTYGLYQNNH